MQWLERWLSAEDPHFVSSSNIRWLLNTHNFSCGTSGTLFSSQRMPVLTSISYLPHIIYTYMCIHF